MFWRNYSNYFRELSNACKSKINLLLVRGKKTKSTKSHKKHRWNVMLWFHRLLLLNSTAKTPSPWELQSSDTLLNGQLCFEAIQIYNGVTLDFFVIAPTGICAEVSHRRIICAWCCDSCIIINKIFPHCCLRSVCSAYEFKLCRRMPRKMTFRYYFSIKAFQRVCLT